MGYLSQAVSSLVLTGALAWIAVTNRELMPGWLIAAAGVASALTLASALRALRKRRYYEGPRVAMIVDPSLDRSTDLPRPRAHITRER
jgi:hypothetical protein